MSDLNKSSLTNIVNLIKKKKISSLEVTNPKAFPAREQKGKEAANTILMMSLVNTMLCLFREHQIPATRNYRDTSP